MKQYFLIASCSIHIYYKLCIQSNDHEQVEINNKIKYNLFRQLAVLSKF